MSNEWEGHLEWRRGVEAKKKEGNINPKTTSRFFFFFFFPSLLGSRYENILRAFRQERLSLPAHFHIVLTQRRPAELLYRRWPTEFIGAAADSVRPCETHLSGCDCVTSLAAAGWLAGTI